MRAQGQLIHPDGFGALSPDGGRSIYPASGGPHALDLWAVERAGDDWSAPVLLTGASAYAYNTQPSVSGDGSRVIFDCGREPYGADGTALCEVGSDGRGFRVLLTPAARPGGLPERGTLHHGAYASDGSIVFEGDWDGERIRRLPAGKSEPVPIAPASSDDNSPCVFASVRIASLWPGRPGADSLHELKLISADGHESAVMLPGVDVADIGFGCGD